MFKLNLLYSWVGVQGVVSMINNERDQRINPSVMDHTHFMRCTSQLNHVNGYDYLDPQHYHTIQQIKQKWSLHSSVAMAAVTRLKCIRHMKSMLTTAVYITPMNV